MTTSLSAGIDVREVTDVDRRTARRLGMDADKVNLVIATWAEEYIRYERESTSLSEKANAGKAEAARAERATRGPARKSAPAKAAAKSPRKAAAKPAGTPEQRSNGESATGAQTATMSTAEAEALAGDGK